MAGEVGKILIREKSGEKIELGDLLAVDDKDGYLLIQVYDLLYGSQISRLWREQMAGLKLEGLGAGLEFFEPQLRNYILAAGKAVLRVTSKVQAPKVLPDFFGTVRHAETKDFQFLGKPANPMYLGQVRSGSKVIDVPVYLDASEALVHHILIASTTGRGKSNLVKVMLWGIVGNEQIRNTRARRSRRILRAISQGVEGSSKGQRKCCVLFREPDSRDQHPLDQSEVNLARAFGWNHHSD